MVPAITATPSSQKGKEGADAENLEVIKSKMISGVIMEIIVCVYVTVYYLCSTARFVHLSNITCLQELNTGKLFILVSNGLTPVVTC